MIDELGSKNYKNHSGSDNESNYPRTRIQHRRASPRSTTSLAIEKKQIKRYQPFYYHSSSLLNVSYVHLMHSVMMLLSLMLRCILLIMTSKEKKFHSVIVLILYYVFR